MCRSTTCFPLFSVFFYTFSLCRLFLYSDLITLGCCSGWTEELFRQTEEAEGRRPLTELQPAGAYRSEQDFVGFVSGRWARRSGVGRWLVWCTVGLSGGSGNTWLGLGPPGKDGSTDRSLWGCDANDQGERGGGCVASGRRVVAQRERGGF